MKFRLVTVTLTVALGCWTGGAAFAQAQEEIPDLVVPTQELDRALQSELPLQGVLEDTRIQGSIAEALPPQPRVVEREGELVYVLRRRASQAPWPKIALGSGALCVLLAAGWAVVSASRKRARRAMRRAPRSAGGAPLRSLDEVVASVQFGHSKSPSGPSLQDHVAGREWPNQL